MTADRDLGSTLAIFFREGPNQAPDRVMAVVADRIGRERQRPAWPWRQLRWPARSSSRALVVLAAALLLALIGSTVISIARPKPTSIPIQTIGPATPAPPAAPVEVFDPATLAPGRFLLRTDYGPTTFVVPAGWSVTTLGPLDYSLKPDGVASDDTVRVFFDMYIASKDPACSETPQPGIDPTSRAMIADLVLDPRLQTSIPVSFHVGGLVGQRIDLRMAATNTRTCPFSNGSPTVPILVDDTRHVPQQGKELKNGPFWGVGGTERLRVMVLDRPGGTGNVVFVIDSADGSTFDDLVAKSMPVLESFTFDTGS